MSSEGYPQKNLNRWSKLRKVYHDSQLMIICVSVIQLLFQNLVEKPESEGERVKGDPARDLGTLHHICVSHLKELQALSKTQVGAL